MYFVSFAVVGWVDVLQEKIIEIVKTMWIIKNRISDLKGMS